MSENNKEEGLSVDNGSSTDYGVDDITALIAEADNFRGEDGPYPFDLIHRLRDALSSLVQENTELKDAPRKAIEKVQSRLAGEDAVTWARDATGSSVSLAYTIAVCDELIEELGEKP